MTPYYNHMTLLVRSFNWHWRGQKLAKSFTVLLVPVPRTKNYKTTQKKLICPFISLHLQVSPFFCNEVLRSLLSALRERNNCVI